MFYFEELVERGVFSSAPVKGEKITVEFVSIFERVKNKE